MLSAPLTRGDYVVGVASGSHCQSLMNNQSFYSVLAKAKIQPIALEHNNIINLEWKRSKKDALKALKQEIEIAGRQRRRAPTVDPQKKLPPLSRLVTEDINFYYIFVCSQFPTGQSPR